MDSLNFLHQLVVLHRQQHVASWAHNNLIGQTGIGIGCLTLLVKVVIFLAIVPERFQLIANALLALLDFELSLGGLYLLRVDLSTPIGRIGL